MPCTLLAFLLDSRFNSAPFVLPCPIINKSRLFNVPARCCAFYYWPSTVRAWEPVSRLGCKLSFGPMDFGNSARLHRTEVARATRFDRVRWGCDFPGNLMTWVLRYIEIWLLTLPHAIRELASKVLKWPVTFGVVRESRPKFRVFSGRRLHCSTKWSFIATEPRPTTLSFWAPSLNREESLLKLNNSRIQIWIRSFTKIESICPNPSTTFWDIVLYIGLALSLNGKESLKNYQIRIRIRIITKIE